MTTLNHVRHGSGQPLVLIHGIGHRWQAWSPVLERLAPYHDVIAPDLPGFGQSPVPAGGMAGGMPALARAVVEFVASLGGTRPHYAGNSLGGAIALEVGALGHAASVTAFSPAGFCTPGETRAALRRLRRMRASSFLPWPVVRASLRFAPTRRRIFGNVMARPELVDADRAVEETLALRNGRGFEPVARSGRGYRYSGAPAVPVTIAWGERDRIFPCRQLDVVRRDLPEARHVLMAGCGHVPMADDPDLVASLILTTTGALTPDRPRVEP